MDNIVSEQIPPIILQGYEYLKIQKIVRITKALQSFDASNYQFECLISVPYPNKDNIPSEVLLRVLIPDTFPFPKIYFYPLSEEIRDFPHQPQGYLCLKDDRLAHHDYTKLFCYVQWAKEWLQDAATGNLQKDGEPFEIPNFEIHENFPIIFNESNSSYTNWKPHFAQYGKAICFLEANGNIFALKFGDKSGKDIVEAEYSKKFPTTQQPIEPFNPFSVGWVLLPNVCYKRYRTPKNYKEFIELFSRYDMDFDNIWEYAKYLFPKRAKHIPVLLVGFPIPKYFGKEPQEIHWKPLFHKGDVDFQTDSGLILPKPQTAWGPSFNISKERMYKRGAYSELLQKLKFSVIGCGALGSQVAELLARGGIEYLSLFDYDIINFGNLCRHTLDGRDIQKNKAVALAQKLSCTNIFSEIIGHPFFIPLSQNTKNNDFFKLAHKSFEQTDIFIDCSTNEATNSIFYGKMIL